MITRRNFIKGLLGTSGLVLLDNPLVRGQNLESILNRESLNSKKSLKTYPRSILISPGPNDNKLWLAPTQYNKQMYGVVGLTGQDSRWHIAQWSIPEQLPVQTIDLCNNIWKVENKYATVKVIPTYSGYKIELTQNATDLKFACNEFDLLLEPNIPRAYPDVPTGVVSNDKLLTLDKISDINMKFNSKIISAYEGNRCSQGINLASTLIAMIFENSIKNQYLFYQIATYDSRPEYRNFENAWFPTAPYYGVSDSIQVHNQPSLIPGGRTINYNVNIANRIKQLIKIGPSQEYLTQNNLPEFDKNISNWKIDSPYYGSYTSGEGKIKSQYDSIDVVIREYL